MIWFSSFSAVLALMTILMLCASVGMILGAFVVGAYYSVLRRVEQFDEEMHRRASESHRFIREASGAGCVVPTVIADAHARIVRNASLATTLWRSVSVEGFFRSEEIQRACPHFIVARA